MKLFIRKIIVFCSIGVALLSMLLVIIQFVLIENPVPNKRLEQKIVSIPLDSTKLNIIIAGDSRAERQIIPEIFEETINCNAVNIATSSNDLITSIFSIKQHLKNSNIKAFVILSASSFQINDGAIDDGYLTDHSFSMLTIYEKLHIYKSNLSNLKRITKRSINNLLSKKRKQTIKPSKIEFKGFLPVDKTLTEVKDGNSYLESHPWYKNININGSRTRLLKQAIDSMGKMKIHFVIIQPPISPNFRDIINNTDVEKMESNYSDLLSTYVKNYPNIDFFDFYNNDIESSDNSLYYDPQHLNANGAKVFTKYLINELKKNTRTHNILCK